jgi:hypothetical protein
MRRTEWTQRPTAGGRPCPGTGRFQSRPPRRSAASSVSQTREATQESELDAWARSAAKGSPQMLKDPPEIMNRANAPAASIRPVDVKCISVPRRSRRSKTKNKV